MSSTRTSSRGQVSRQTLVWVGVATTVVVVLLLIVLLSRPRTSSDLDGLGPITLGPIPAPMQGPKFVRPGTTVASPNAAPPPLSQQNVPLATSGSVPKVTPKPPISIPSGEELIVAAMAKGEGVRGVLAGGVISRVIEDDPKLRRRQRFEITLRNRGAAAKSTAKIEIERELPATSTATNTPIQLGDSVLFSGDYEWSPDGGIVRFPLAAAGQPVTAWLRINGVLVK